MRSTKSTASNRWHQHERQRLEKFLKQVKDARSYRRIQAVFLVATGELVSKVAQVLGVSRQSVHGWLRRYRQSRAPEDRQEGPRAGRPLTASVITPARIAGSVPITGISAYLLD